MIPEWYKKRREFISDEITSYLENTLKHHNLRCIKDFKEAIMYACEGGKKIRAVFSLEFYLSLKNISFEQFLSEKKSHKNIIFYCIALELMHAYSLVHDDLPCMDNDTMRRGKPTVWKKYGEWQATLVGDALNTLAFQAISEIQESVIALKLVNLLAKSSGFEGMVGGQLMDLYYEENSDKINLKKLYDLHNKKTACLVKASVQGSILISEKLDFLHRFSAFGEKLGLAFQIKDDILDVEGDKEKVGKSIGGEQKGFVYFLGLENSKQKLKSLIDDCIISINILHSENISYLVNYIGKREE